MFCVDVQGDAVSASQDSSQSVHQRALGQPRLGPLLRHHGRLQVAEAGLFVLDTVMLEVHDLSRSVEFINLYIINFWQPLLRLFPYSTIKYKPHLSIYESL